MSTTKATMNETGRSWFVARAVEWLRAGYPSGMPRQDYVVLLGLLRRTLSDEEVREIAETVAAGFLDAEGGSYEDAIRRADIERLIQQSVLQEPSAADVARVSAHLAAGGWPLAEPPAQ